MTTDMRQSQRAGEKHGLASAHSLKKLIAGTTAHAPGAAGLESRHVFSKALNRELARTWRGHSNGGVIVLIDFDNCAAVHERHGPGAVQACVKLISHILASEVRAMDIAAVLGDDEFALLLADTSTEKSAWRVQNLALRLNNLSLIWQLKEIQIGASLSMKSYGPNEEPDAVPGTKTFGTAP
jgi:diguanylate cyclase (GGDEF)-like protein